MTSQMTENNKKYEQFTPGYCFLSGPFDVVVTVFLVTSYKYLLLGTKYFMSTLKVHNEISI